MGGKSGGSQVIGHRYYASVVKFIGFRIEGIFAVNFDKRGWIWADPRYKTIGSKIDVNEPNLYGETEGGVKGVIEAHLGEPNQKPNLHYQAHDPLISGFPYKSYLVFRGAEDTVVQEKLSGINGLITKLKTKLGRHSFYHGNTNYMKDCLLWPKRTRVQNTGDQQWYMMRDDGAIVCEIGARDGLNTHGEMLPVSSATVKITHNYEGTQSGTRSRVETRDFNRVIRNVGNWGSFATLTPTWEYRFFENNVPFFYSVDLSLPDANCDYVAVFQAGFGFVGNRPNSAHLHSIDVGPGSIIKTEIDSNSKIWYVSGRGRISATIRSNLYGPEDGVGYYFNHSARLVGFYQIPKNDPILAEGLDINPIHKIREIITNPHPWGMSRDEVEINDDNFKAAADRIYDEGLGISWAIKDKDCIEAIEELCHHIDAGVRINRNTGKYEVVLFRDDWDNEDPYQILESQIKDMQPELTDADELINHLDVSFYDRDNIKDGTFSISENGLIKTTGQVNAQDLEFPYFMNMRNAEVVAQWKLKNLSTAKWKGTFTTGSRDARKFQKYGVIELPWSRKWSGKIKARILNINLGDGVDNTVSIEFEEIVPKSGAMMGSVIADQQSVGVLEPKSSQATVFEVPYYLAVHARGQREVDDELDYDDSIGYVAALAMPAQYNSIYAAMYSNEAYQSPNFERVATVNYCEGLQLDQAITRTMHSFIVKETQFVQSHNARRFAGATAETLIKINDEFMSFVDFNDETKVLTVKRGVLETGVFDHPINSYLYIFDMADLAVNQTQFYDSDEVVSKVLTTTPSGAQPLEYAKNHVTVVQSRAIRPYPPANVKFNGNYWIETHVVSSDLVLTWSHRNRKQQTASSHVDWFDASVTVENGVTYSLELSTIEDGVIHTVSNIDADTYTIDADVFMPNKAHRLKLWSVRDGFDSYAVFEHNFFAEAVSLILTASVTSNSASGNTVPTANISVDVDTSLKANVWFDGTKVVGKALPNSTITIEIEE